MTKDKVAWIALGVTILGSVLGLSSAWGSVQNRLANAEGRIDRWEPRFATVTQKVDKISDETSGLKQFEHDVEFELAGRREPLR